MSARRLIAPAAVAPLAAGATTALAIPPWCGGTSSAVTEHARAIVAGTPADLERIAAEHGLLAT